MAGPFDSGDIPMNRGGQTGAAQSMENCPTMKGLAQEEANDHAAPHPENT
jgi:hypothetical protein